ncbi:MAG: response regulator [Opitutaceae bacterium]
MTKNDLSLNVDHTTAFHIDESINGLKQKFNDSSHNYAAAVSGSKVIGIVSRKQIENLSLKKSDPAHTARDYLIEDPIICSPNESLEQSIDQAMSRPAESILDDIVVIDQDKGFVGLITFNTILRLQKQLNADKLASSASLQSAQAKEIQKLKGELENISIDTKEDERSANDATKSRLDFLHNFSHEAFTSMTGIQGILEILSDTKICAEQSQMIQSARLCTSTLRRLIDNTLDFSRIESGQCILTETTYAPNKIAEQCYEEAKFEAYDKGLGLELNNDDTPQQVIGDRIRFRRILRELIYKSIEQTSTGRIQIFLSSKTADDGQQTLVTEILRIGIDLESTAVASLFSINQPNVRQHTTYDVNTHICTRIAKEMGGNITHSSENAYKHRTLFELPIRAVKPNTTTEASGAPKVIQKNKVPTNSPQLEVLVVDDNDINLMVASQLLLKLDCKVHVATSGEECIRKLKELPIDCIFLDRQMPILTGNETARQIRSGIAGDDKANVFISAVTANVTRQARQECAEAGMNHFIAKPVSKRNLKQALDAFHRLSCTQETECSKSAKTA